MPAVVDTMEPSPERIDHSLVFLTCPVTPSTNRARSREGCAGLRSALPPNVVRSSIVENVTTRRLSDVKQIDSAGPRFFTLPGGDSGPNDRRSSCHLGISRHRLATFWGPGFSNVVSDAPAPVERQSNSKAVLVPALANHAVTTDTQTTRNTLRVFTRTIGSP